MSIIRSIIMTFSMFSCIKTPQVEWKKENMQTMLAFLPLVGCTISCVMFAFKKLCSAFDFHNAFSAAVMTLIPVIISGGIHLDGFCDTVDALSSRGTVEKKHEILKDSHAGTFSVIWLIAYFLITFSVYFDKNFFENSVYVYCLIPIFSRISSGFASLHFKKYTSDGLLKTFTQSSKKGISTYILAIFFIVFTAFCVYLNAIMAVGLLLSMALCLIYVYFMSKKQFGGLSGDISGFLLVISELFMLISVFLAQKIL